MNNATRTPPGHIQQAQAALAEAGIPLVVGTQALALAAHFYHQPPQVSQTDAMRRERNRIRDESETVSSQLLQELAATRELPKTHQNKAYKLRKRLRAVLAVLQHPGAKDTTKLRRIANLVTGVLAGAEDPAPALLA